MKALSYHSKQSVKRLAGLLLLFVSLFCMDLDAFGRAGGGGGYSGGGGGGGGFSGGGSFGGSSGGRGKQWSEMSPFERIIFVSSMGGFIILYGTLAIREKMQKGNLLHIEVGETWFDLIDQNRHQALESKLQLEDEHFHAHLFIERFNVAFLAIQDAWQHQDMSPVRHFVSDGIYERFSLQIKEQIDLGYRNFMDKIDIHDAALADFHRGAFFETITVHVNASAVDYRVDKDSGNYLTGSRSKQRFTEYWSFIRRVGVRTQADQAGLIEGKCPNCHTQVSMNQSSDCPSCRAHLKSGEYDWVLAEITQACEWTPVEGLLPASVEKYQTLDPGFNLQHIEDRASVIFWRKVHSDRVASINPLLKMASESYCANGRKRFKDQEKDGKRSYYGDCAVGSVDCLGVFQREDADYALVQVKWAGYWILIQGKGKVVKRDWSRKQSLFVLTRQKGVQTNLATAIQSAHCPGCGAAESDVTSHACEYCGAVLNDGSHDWILMHACSLQSKTAFGWRQSLEEIESHVQSVKSSMDLTEWVIQIVAADGLLKSEEQDAILKLCSKLGLDEGHAKGLIAAVTERHGETLQPPDHSVGKQWLEAITDIALADGVVSDEEKAVLLKLGAFMDWAEIDVNLLINKRRAIFLNSK